MTEFSSDVFPFLERNHTYEKMEESQRALHKELAEAAFYVESLLPKPIDGNVKTAWKFIPSEQLGGDAFGYRWIDLDHFAFYLLDVCGHGIGAALLSISLMNVLRSQALFYADYVHPEQVLEVLNANFPMEEHNNMFFTIWYGVYNRKKRRLKYSSGGHPPAVLVDSGPGNRKKIQELRAGSAAVGIAAETVYTSSTCQIKQGARLYLYSDGIYELSTGDKTALQLEEFIQAFSNPSKEGQSELDRIVGFSQSIIDGRPFADDVSLLEITFT
jgi:sigma-B regulation protein RsbU (phosphoserine phosphatase)